MRLQGSLNGGGSRTTDIRQAKEANKNMNSTRRARLGAAVAAMSVLPATAFAFDYNFLEGGFIYRDDYHQDSVGGRIAGSINVLPPLAIIGEFTGNDNLDQFDVGAIFHAPIDRRLDLFGGATLEHGDIHDFSSTGIGARFGVRWQAASGIELAPEFRYVHLFHEDQASFRLNGLFHLAPHLDAQGAFQVGDDDRFELGLRYSFSPTW